MTDHTPGPWIYESGMVYAANSYRDDSRLAHGRGIMAPIALMDREAGNGTSPAERDMNARLIAAAPELLVAARNAARLLARLRDREVVADAPEIRELGAAITKATNNE